ncbi:HopJ type III effector protein [Alteromonas gilva]|uniref:HopJ type III effector protein n=1 Tax=Alteromonas gilva TaxID=2987522 RepID=A0ABT5L0W1_9ALTE|nr:HopJ type III effector protein [Alteromonas gilva]MDC8830669.1 HopJ type III effector protein [Alteromonas gilva]
MALTRLDALTAQLDSAPATIEFSHVIELIDAHFKFTPTAFTNGSAVNKANQNNGSCKLLALGQYLKLTNEQTLALFGTFYREDVLGHPHGSDHANIRNFMQSGHAGVHFDVFPLALK